MSNDKNIITKTNDGYVVELFAKIGVKDKIEEGLEGVSILETANILLEEELYSLYSEIVDKLDYNPVIIKAPENQKDIMVFKTQLRAMLRAATQGDLSIVFSKVSTVEEIREYKQILEQCQKELEAENTTYKKHMKIGVIVEIPSVALMSYEIARECDFFFIDTESLTNYSFGNKKEKKLCEKIQLPVIKLLQHTIEGAHDAGIFCGISGQAVENELYMPLLIGLGIDQFSIDKNNIPKVRLFMHQLNKSDCKELVEEIIQLRTLEDIETKLKMFLDKVIMKHRGDN